MPLSVSTMRSDTDKSRVHVLYTGGTIGMLRPSPSHPLVPGGIHDLLQQLPELRTLPVQVTTSELRPLLDSTNIGPQNWLAMADAVAENYDDHDGFVILHGTDTLAYSASVLAFMFENLSKPVVFTGAQLPISDPRSDARSNLINSILVAGTSGKRLPLIPEVIVVFGSKILRGCRTTKTSSHSFDAFASPNCPQIGNISGRIAIDRTRVRRTSLRNSVLNVNRNICENINVYRCHPGQDGNTLSRMSDVSAGIVLESFGTGNLPTVGEFPAALQEVSKKGTVLLNISQCANGQVEMGLYATNEQTIGSMLNGADMTTEAAFAKLACNLSLASNPDGRRKFQRSLRGEQSYSIDELKCGPIVIDATQTETASVSTQPIRAELLMHAFLRLSDVHADVPDGGEVALHVYMKPVGENAELICAFTLRNGANGPLLQDVNVAAFGALKDNGTMSLSFSSDCVVRIRDCIIYVVTRELI